MFWCTRVPCAVPSHVQGWTEQMLTFLPCASHTLYRLGGNTGDRRTEVCWSAKTNDVTWSRIQQAQLALPASLGMTVMICVPSWITQNLCLNPNRQHLKRLHVQVGRSEIPPTYVLIFPEENRVVMYISKVERTGTAVKHQIQPQFYFFFILLLNHTAQSLHICCAWCSSNTGYHA